jgi:IS30 family transposase
VYWSPQQIAAQLICDYPDDLNMRVSHETIYKTLFIQARGALRKELTACLRTGRAQRRPHMRTEQSGAGRLQNMVLISDRPPEIEDRAVPGHWEGDLIIGKGGRSAIGTLVERSSRYVVLLHLPHGRTAAQQPPSTNPELDETIRSVRPDCCVDRLRTSSVLRTARAHGDG